MNLFELRDGKTATKVVSLFCIVILVTAVVAGSIPAAVATEVGDTDEPTDVPAGVIDESLEGASEPVEVVVRLDETNPTSGVDAQEHAQQTQQPIEQLAETQPGIEIENRFWITNAVVVTIDPKEVPIERIAQMNNVNQLHANFEAEVEGSVAQPPDNETGSNGHEIGATNLPTASGDNVSPEFNPVEGVDLIGAPDVWDKYDTKGEDARVAVLDTGIDADHDDLDLYTEDSEDPTYPGGWAEFSSTGSIVEGSEPHDESGHGTHVSGTVAGGNESGLDIGVAPETELMHGMVIPDGSGSFSQIVGGIEWAVENDADVITMSLGVDGYSSAFVEPIQNANAEGSVVTASIGNSGEGTSSSPGNEYDSIGVGATSGDLGVSIFSGGELINTEEDWGTDAPDEWPDEYIVPSVVADGQAVYSTVPGNDHQGSSGTSMAAPHVAGAVALAQSATEEHQSPDEIEEALQSTAWKPDDWDEDDAENVLGEQDTRFGYGFADAPATIEYLEEDASVEDAKLSENEVTEGETVDVTATIENDGDETETLSVDLEVDDNVVQTEDIEIDGGEQSEVVFTEVFDEAGEYDVSVNGVDAGAVTVLASADLAVIDAELADEEITAGDEVEITATVENGGDEAGTHTVDLQADGDVIVTEEVEVAAGETEEITFNELFDDAGEYDLTINNISAGTLSVLSPADIAVVDADLPEDEVSEGDEVDIATTVENTGGETGTHVLELEVEDEVVESEEIEVAGGEQETVVFTQSFSDAGEYEVSVNSVDAGTVTVVAPADIAVIDAVLSDEEITAGDEVEVAAAVENHGDEAGSYTIELKNDGDVLQSEDIEIAGGETKDVDFTETFDEAGEYSVSVNDVHAGDLTVLTPADISVVDAELADEDVSVDEAVEIAATVENDGEEAGTHTVELEVDGTVVQTQDVNVDGDATEVVEFTETFGDAGTFDVSVNSIDAGILSVLAPPDIEVTEANLSEDEVTEGEEIEVSASVENSGDEAGAHTVALEIDDTVVQAKEIEIDGGESQQVEFVESFADAGEYDVSVDDADAGALTVLAPADIQVTDTALSDEEISAGEEFEVIATVENDGDKTGTHTVDLEIDGQVVQTKDVDVAGGDSKEVAFAKTIDEAGEYELTVGNESVGTLTVEPADASFDITDLAVSESEVSEGDTFTVSVEVVNVGDHAATDTVQIAVGDSTVEEREIELDAEESETLSITVDTWEESIEHGDYVLTATTSADQETTTVTVERSVATYADENGVVQTSGYSDALLDWRYGIIDRDLLNDVQDAWQTGEPVV